MKSYEDFLWELFLGATITTNAAEATASTTAITNVKGTSVVSATVGIASVAITSGDHADAKMGKVIVKATAATTVDVFYSTNIDFNTGTDETFDDDNLLVETGIVIPSTGGTVALANFGLEFTGGSGTVLMVANDTAEFKVRPVNTASTDIDVGATASTFPEFGSIMMAAKRSNSEMFEIEAFKCTGIGMPINLAETAFSIPDLTVTCLYDSVKNKVFSVRHVVASV